MQRGVEGPFDFGLTARGLRSGRAETGSFTPLAGAVALVLAVLALGAMTVGRLAAVKGDSQRAADAAALAAAQIIRDRGMPFNASKRAAAEQVARGNSKLPIAFVWSVGQDGDSVNIDVTARIATSAPKLVVGSGTEVVQSRAKAEVPQRKFDEAERRLPKLALVLDYSGSMTWPFVGGGVKINVLEASIGNLLARGLSVDYGAVFYSSNVFRTVAVGPTAPAQIQSIMNMYGAGGATNTPAALSTARALLTPTKNTGWYVLLVSDGAPCVWDCGPADRAATRAAAVNLWNSDITIFTLEIRDRPPDPRLAQLMTDVAGSPSSRRDPNYHFVAESAADLVKKFEDIIANIVCTVGPLDPAPADPGSMKVYLATAVSERVVAPVPPGQSLATYRAEERYTYSAADRKVRLTEAACDAVIEAGDDVVIRFDRATLVE